MVYRAGALIVFAVGLCSLPVGVAILRINIPGGLNVHRAFIFAVVGAGFGMVPVLPMFAFGDIQDFILNLLHC